jgi:hypothetical protein
MAKLGVWLSGRHNKDALIPNPMGTTGPAGTDSAEGQVMAEDTYAEGWVLTDPNDPDPANTMVFPVALPAAIAATIPQQQQATMGNHGGVSSLPGTEFLGIRQTLHWLGHTMFDPAILGAELKLQWDIQGNVTKQNDFKEFAINYTQLWVYIEMLGDQKTITMIHTLRAFYSLNMATNSYQGKVLIFIGDWQATKEPTPSCLPQTKTWKWYTGQAMDNAEALVNHFGDPNTRGTWWRPTEGATTKMKVPYLHFIPNALVELLRNQGTQATPADVWTTLGNVIANGGMTEVQWETMC